MSYDKSMSNSCVRLNRCGDSWVHKWQHFLCPKMKVYISKKDLKVKIYLGCI